MSILTLAWTDPTTALRDWLRASSSVTALVAQRSYANGLPNSPTLPAIVVTRVGGGPSLPIDIGLYQFDCWAATGSEAAALVNALVRLLYSTPSGTALGSLTYGGAVEDPEIVWQPDPVDATPRYVVTAQVVTKTPNSP
jgi:hypothetical protein